ncbi:hypothetical protein KGQ20_46915, partial [Catenulispora sp. NF23]
IKGLTQKDPDRPTSLDRAFAELSRLGAPLEAEHGADTLHEAQAASAEAEAADETEATDEAGTEPAAPTQAISTAESPAESGENESPADDDPDATHVSEADDDPDATHVPEAEDEAADEAADSDTRTMSVLRKRDAIPEPAQQISAPDPTDSD